MSTPRTPIARLFFVLALSFMAAACTSSTEVITSTDISEDPVTTLSQAAEATEPAQPEPADTDEVLAAEQEPTDEEPTEEELMVDEPVAAGTVDVVFDDGRAWTLARTDCSTDPDSAFGVFFMVGTGDGDVELNVVESWPLDGDQSNGTSFLASFVDETGQFYTLTGGPVVDDGATLSFSSPVYQGLSTEPATTGHFTCTK